MVINVVSSARGIWAIGDKEFFVGIEPGTVIVVDPDDRVSKGGKLTLQEREAVRQKVQELYPTKEVVLA